MKGLFRIILKMNIIVIVVISKSISAINRAFRIIFVRIFYFIRLSSKGRVTLT